MNTEIREEVLKISHGEEKEEVRWLSTGWRGGFVAGSYVYNISVPEGWDCEKIEEYVEKRLEESGFGRDGPVLLTGVSMRHAVVAMHGEVEVMVTAGLSNPASLSMDRSDSETKRERFTGIGSGTVNIGVCVDKKVSEAGLANLATVAAEAKTATLLDETGFTGTTTDAVVVGSPKKTGETPEEREEVKYTGSATEIGNSTRLCVRDALRASLKSRYSERRGEIPKSVGDAKHGVLTEGKAEVRKVDDKVEK